MERTYKHTHMGQHTLGHSLVLLYPFSYPWQLIPPTLRFCDQ